MRFLELLKTDLIKEKRSAIWLLIFVIPLGTTAAMIFDMCIRYKSWLYPICEKSGINSWEMLLKENDGPLCWTIFLPLFIAIIAAIIHQTEFKQNSWKNILSLPITKSSVYMSKLICILIFSFLLIGLNSLGLILVGKITGFPEPLQHSLFIKHVIYQFIGIFGVAAIHNFLSAYFKNGVIPVAIGFGGFIFAYSFINGSPKPTLAKLFPYCHAFYNGTFKDFQPNVALYGGIIVGIIFTAIGIFEFNKKDIF